MKEYLTLGSSPTDENCAQVGDEDYQVKSREECRRYIDLLLKKFGPEPTGAKLSVKSFPHDFGSYREVVCWYDTEIPESFNYCLNIENNLPRTWEG